MMRCAISLFSAILSLSAFCDTEIWQIVMTLDVPRVYENTKSLGFRKYQSQQLKGYFEVDKYSSAEPYLTFCYLENVTHKVNGRNVTYDVIVDDVKWHGIGSNLTDQFNTRSCVISLVAEPSYSIGPEPTEDNSLLVTLSGKGTKTYIRGYAAGQLGCGCMEYGHTSPTRIWDTDVVVDTAAVYGTWKARKIKKR